jgi:hypothetical protein
MIAGLARSSDYPAPMELAYLVVLVAAFVAIGVMSGYILYKLFAGQR